ncbi:endolytic transglycosylase MltG [Candidatus Vallotia tarda]|uniref:Endolytic murein transglycosylase n=1 Tax=Candidatus Vallotiella hemipterorum TaxID=1177213 RepID=A0A916NLM4_9BURK|nr:endolytic transglycosylase MltG [Candidatus Vallotia tarda]CAG7601982.1 Endolytic transglycosylase MltG [Candidatus Vallotia tarda]
MFVFKRVLFSTVAIAAFGIFIACSSVWYWARAPIHMTLPLNVTIQPRSGLRSIAFQLRCSGVPIERHLFVLMARILGMSLQLKPGHYVFSTEVTPYDLLQKLAKGNVRQCLVTIIEGWTFRRMRDEINTHPALRHDSVMLSDSQLMRKIMANISPTDQHKTSTQNALHMLSMKGVPVQKPEGLFFPDTYLFEENTSDLDIYRRSYHLMHLRIQREWEGRSPGLPYLGPYDALKMASIIEKETGRAKDKPLVASVFINRLRLSMPLQTDSTVIYGLGTLYTGQLCKKDLQTDTPYNTYIRGGLPPTPISLPGNASLKAALHGASSEALYFVSRGDGSTHFSNNLVDHNKAVDKYIRGR